MSKLALYEAALQQLADQGNEAAKMALALGGTQGAGPNVSGAVSHMQNAVECCTRALHHNGTEWTHRTDHAVRDAVTNITQAMRLLSGG